MMEVPYTILNPHISDFFGKPLAFVLLKRRALKKYSYLIDVPVAQGQKVNILVNGANSGLIPDSLFRRMPLFMRRQWLRYEMQLWLKHNELKGKVNIHFSPSGIKDKSTLLFLCYRNFYFPNDLQKSCAAFSQVIGHLSHYYLHPGGYSRAVKDIPNLWLASDVDVSGNAFFRHFFPWYQKQVKVVPFAVGDRFVPKVPFESRQPKAVATGTFHMIETETFNDQLHELKAFARTNTIHPLRRSIFENKEKLQDVIDCFCFPYFESEMKEKKWYHRFVPKRYKVTQASYFSFNIVDKYNEYRYAIVGEEFYNGIPGIGAFEAMACGTVLIGHPDCYQGTGLEPGVHYLPHHNDTSEIIDTIQKANNAPQRTREMAEKATALVKEQYTPVALWKKFLHITGSLR
ncbi:MAG TPA: glycosyltransferase [Flavisolibacter sp.]|nr:glycosyltransferase [Flavisolibacter sp.]